MTHRRQTVCQVCVCNICIDVKLLPFFLSSSFSLSNLDLYIYINNAGGPGPSFPTWSNEAGIWRGMHWGTLRCVPASGRSWALVWQLGVPGTLLGPLMTAGGPASYIFISPRSSISPRYLFTGFAFRRRWLTIMNKQDQSPPFSNSLLLHAWGPRSQSDRYKDPFLSSVCGTSEEM